MTFCELPLWEICVQAEEILIGCFVECQSTKKVGGRRSVEEFYQALFFVSPFPPECFTERNENRAWSQVTSSPPPPVRQRAVCVSARMKRTREQARLSLGNVACVCWAGACTKQAAHHTRATFSPAIFARARHLETWRAFGEPAHALHKKLTTHVSPFHRLFSRALATWKRGARLVSRRMH